MQDDPIIKLPDPILRTRAILVTNFESRDLKNTIERMFEVMHSSNGVGIAAPQIGVSQRIFVYGFDATPRYPDAKPVARDVAINPEIIDMSTEEIALDEGCLSVPYKRASVKRAQSVTFSYFDIDGNQHQKTLTDFAARIIQHEIDHLNGILYIDRCQDVRDSAII